MNLLDVLRRGLDSFNHSKFYDAALWLGIVFIAFTVVVGVLLILTYLLKTFFYRHSVVNQFHKTLIYLFTMSGVVLLFIGGILGVLLPIIPGIPLIIAALLLMRKYHRWEWLEGKIATFRRWRNQEKLNKSKQSGSSGGKHARANNRKLQ
jgi:hypothetical protein